MIRFMIGVALAIVPDALAQVPSLLDRQDYARAVALLESAVRDVPRDVAATAALADVLIEVGEYQRAEAVIKALTGLPPSSASALVQARMAELRGDLASAEARLKDALTIEEKAGDSATRIAPVSARLGRFYLDHGRLAGAEREFKTAIKRLNAEHDRAHTFGADHADDSYFSLESIVGLGEIAAARGDVSGADRYFKQAVRRYPAPATLGRIADFYEAHGKTPQAEDARNRMTKVVTDQPRYRRDLARYWADRGQRLDEALAWVEAEAVLRRDVHTLDALAWVLSQSKRPAEAARAIEPVLPWAAGDAGVLSRAARILRAAGKPDEAAKLAEQARKANPSVN